MKRTTLFLAILLVCGAFASCLRSDDLEILKHPIHVTGSISPQYGVPVATGEMNINDILSRLSAEYQGLLATDEDVVTITYSASLSDTIHAFSQLPSMLNVKQSNAPTKDGATWYSKDTIITDTIDIDFFNDVEVSGQINMEHIWLKLGVRAFGECPEAVRPYIQATFDELSVSYLGHDDSLEDSPHPFPGISVDPIIVTDITEGFSHDFDTVDIARMANDMPRRIFTRYRFRFQVSSDFLTDMSGMSGMYFGSILDSLRMSQLVYTADLGVMMPLSVQFNNLTYTYNLDLGDGLSSVNLDSIVNSIYSGLDVDIDTSIFRLVLDNGIPMDFHLTAIMQDAVDGNDLIDIFNNEHIASANVAPDPATPTHYMATSGVKTTLEAKLDQKDLDKLNKARNLKVILTTDTNNKHVTIRREDFLKIKAYLQLHPVVDIDVTVSENGIL